MSFYSNLTATPLPPHPLILHMAKNNKAVLAKPSSIAQIADCDAASPVVGAKELPVLVASAESPVAVAVAVAVAVHTMVCVVSADGYQLANAGWKS